MKPAPDPPLEAKLVVPKALADEAYGEPWPVVLKPPYDPLKYPDPTDSWQLLGVDFIFTL